MDVIKVHELRLRNPKENSTSKLQWTFIKLGIFEKDPLYEFT